MKYIVWLFYNAVIPLSPIAVVKVISWLTATPPNQPQKMFAIIRDGQVFFYCTALTSVAFGDLHQVPTGFNTDPWVMGFVVIFLFSVAGFVVAAYNRDIAVEARYGWTSVGVAFMTTLTVMMFRDQAGLL